MVLTGPLEILSSSRESDSMPVTEDPVPHPLDPRALSTFDKVVGASAFAISGGFLAYGTRGVNGKMDTTIALIVMSSLAGAAVAYGSAAIRRSK